MSEMRLNNGTKRLLYVASQTRALEPVARRSLAKHIRQYIRDYPSERAYVRSIYGFHTK